MFAVDVCGTAAAGVAGVRLDCCADIAKSRFCTSAFAACVAWFASHAVKSNDTTVAATRAFTVRVPHSIGEACQLVEAGFAYVTDMDGFKIFRKRK